MNTATATIRVVQVSIGGLDSPFVQAALRAARRGVTVRILLSSAWYVREENRALAERLNRRAAALPLTVRLAEPNGRYEKIYAKGVIIDDDQVILGSLNWNSHSAHENREVAIALIGEAVGTYFTTVFQADWNATSDLGDRPLPGGIIAVLGIVILLAVISFTELTSNKRAWRLPRAV